MSERVPERGTDKVVFVIIVFLLSFLVGFQARPIIYSAKAEPPSTTVEFEVIVGNKEVPSLHGTLVIEGEDADTLMSHPLWKVCVFVEKAPDETS